MRHVATPEATLRALRRSMPRARWQTFYRDRVLLSDSLVVVLAVAAAHLLHWQQFADAPVRDGFGPWYWAISALLACLWISSLAMGRAYSTRTFGSGFTEYQRVFDSTWKLFGILAVVAFLASFGEARAYLLYAFPLGAVALVLTRYAWRKRLHRRRDVHGECMTTVVAIGHRDQAERLVERLNRHPYHGYRVVGLCVPDGEASLGETILDVPVLGDLSQAGEVAALVGATSVAVSGSDAMTADAVRSLGWELESAGVDLMLTAELADVAGARIHVTPATGVSLLHVDAPQFGGAKFLVKAIIDRVAAALLVVLLLPALLVVSIGVMIDDPGSPFFLQKRVGKGGSVFTMIKFRTMRAGSDREVSQLAAANEAAGVLFKVRADPRVTRLGRLLRKYSVDELPQLVNVLLGNMSLVGPRPPLEREVVQYGQRMRRRLLVKPGLTGLWQVTGRSDLSWDESVRLDVYYAENWTVLQDLLILAKTARAVVSSRGAY